MLKFFEGIDWDNFAAICFIGFIALTALNNNIETNQIANSVVSGLIGYIARGVNK